MGKNVDSLLARSVTIDRHMQEYEDIVKGEDHAVSVLSSSSLVYFFVSALVLLVAVGGAVLGHAEALPAVVAMEPLQRAGEDRKSVV